MRPWKQDEQNSTVKPRNERIKGYKKCKEILQPFIEELKASEKHPRGEVADERRFAGLPGSQDKDAFCRLPEEGRQMSWNHEVILRCIITSCQHLLRRPVIGIQTPAFQMVSTHRHR